MKKRISLTVDSRLLDQVDKCVANLNFDSRSGFVEHCIGRYMQLSTTAVILAGGTVDRLKIGGQFKFLIPIKDDKTLLDLLLDSLSGFGKIFIVGNKEVIDSCFKRVSEKHSKLEVEYIEERKALGSAKTLELVKSKLPQTFLILPIDQYYEIDFFDLINKHKLNNMISKSLVTQVVSPISTTRKYGRVSMIGSRIVEHEENNSGKKNLVSAFAAVCERKIFDYIPVGEIRWILQNDVYPRIIKEELMSGYLLNTTFYNISTEQDIKDLRKYLKAKS